MKIICCNICDGMELLSREGIKHCKCKNISGRYIDNTIAEIIVKDKTKCRVIGLPNSVRYGLKPTGECFLIPWDSDHLKVEEKK